MATHRTRRRFLDWLLTTTAGSLLAAVLYPLVRFLSPTHLDCIVTYRSELRLIWCWCHNGVYDLTGRNIGGPPPRPLAPFKVQVTPGRRGQPDSLVIEEV